MTERVVLYLRGNLDQVELHGMPAWVDTGIYELRDWPAPSRERFPQGKDALVYSQRNDDRFLYIGVVHKLEFIAADGKFTFASFRRLPRPVLIVQHNTDNAPAFYAEGKGFFCDYTYIPQEAFDAAMKESERGPQY